MIAHSNAAIRGTEVLGLGHATPERIIANAQIETELGLEAGWIEKRTGIRNRRWAADGEAVSDIAVRAGEMALAASRIARENVTLTILATSTPDHLLPPSAPLVAHALGLRNSGAIDMAGACAGFVYALSFADAFSRAHNANVLIIAANILSRRINPAERASAILFADAAGAVLIGPTDRPRTGVLGVDLRSDGSAYDLIKISAGGSRTLFQPGLDAAETLMTITDGRAVFTKAVNMMAETSTAALGSARCTSSDIDHWIPHQANSRIIEATRSKLQLSPDLTLSTVAEFGNSSAASIPFTWSHCAQARDFASGQRVLLSAAGAGLTGGAIVFGL